MKQTFAALTAAAGMSLALIAGPSLAQTFPAQPIRIISPFPAGSGPDAVARIVGDKLAASLKQPIVIDPRPGANGFLAANAVKAAAPTGYDLFLADIGHLTINPSLFKKLPYDPKADFVPVSGVYRASFFIAVGANSPIKNVKDLIAAAAVPGRVTYGSNSIGSPLHLGAAQIEAATNTKMVHVPYKEISQLYAAVSTGEVDWALGSIASAGPLLRAGKLRFIAIADTARNATLPDIPTFDQAGGPRPLSANSWVSLVAPKGTPPAVVTTLNRAINDALKQPDVVEKLAGFGFTPFLSTPADLAKVIDTDTVSNAALVKRTGASVD
ncbi:MAG: tripartite tricarboxylate transporter substrate binding protein [Polaromonas sp.]|uniref:Bug family tripartite tricarboxylate transporter substrate binding protein n=1 Tax=Polaromonas sp. TaxID=1869339 RepID=UPI0025D0EE35|nr:tripartite tricarboxylate transporter substrate binding protein [Polaromonas sp.]MBI2725360.1 tripartite tricarboxylate transporter substrate binding protein [Polaromonas sp.]